VKSFNCVVFDHNAGDGEGEDVILTVLAESFAEAEQKIKSASKWMDIISITLSSTRVHPVRCTCPLNIGWTALGCPNHGVPEGRQLTYLGIAVTHMHKEIPKFDTNLQGDEDGFVTLSYSSVS
jgi:hypothetical protein